MSWTSTDKTEPMRHGLKTGARVKARGTAPAGQDAPKDKLETFIGKFGPTDQRLIRAVRRAVRKTAADGARTVAHQEP